MNKPSTKSIIHGFYDKLTLNKLLIRLTLKSLSPALTTSPASSVGDPAPAMNSSDTQSVSMVDAFTTTTTTLDNKRVDNNVLEMNIFCLFYGLLNSLLPLYQFGTENETVRTDYETPGDGSILKNEYGQSLKSS